MKKIIAALLCAVLLVACLAGCSNEPTPPVNDDPQPSQTDIDTPVEADNALHTAVLDEVDLADFTKVYEYGNDEYECYLIWCESVMENFTYQRIGYDDASGNYFYEDESNNFGTVKPGEAVMLRVMIPEGYPNAVINYTIDGESYEWALGYNGDVGGLSFVEVPIAKG